VHGGKAVLLAKFGAVGQVRTPRVMRDGGGAASRVVRTNANERSLAGTLQHPGRAARPVHTYGRSTMCDAFGDVGTKEAGPKYANAFRKPCQFYLQTLPYNHRVHSCTPHPLATAPRPPRPMAVGLFGGRTPPRARASTRVLNLVRYYRTFDIGKTMVGNTLVYLVDTSAL
jgi:hypothetical protein